MSLNANHVATNWGVDAPAWVVLLAEHCDMGSQQAVAEKLGYSPAVVNQVLKRSYKGSYATVEKAVRGAFAGDTVICPVLGEMPAQKCLQHQRQPFANTNPIRVKLYRACRQGCPNSRLTIDRSES